jgi:predicted N-acetyltransferase YhbS
MTEQVYTEIIEKEACYLYRAMRDKASLLEGTTSQVLEYSKQYNALKNKAEYLNIKKIILKKHRVSENEYISYACSFTNTENEIVAYSGNDIVILPETVSDYKSVYAIHELAFGDHNDAPTIQLLRKTLRYNSELSFTAKYHGKLVGHILFYPVDIVNGSNKTVTLAMTLAEHPECPIKGANVTREMLKHGLRRAAQLGFGSVAVFDKSGYYRNYGFLPSKKWDIKMQFEVSGSTLRILELTPGALEDARGGTIEYPTGLYFLLMREGL